MPVLEPAAALLAVTIIFEPPVAIVIAPKETIVVAVVAVPVMLIALAETAPANTTAALALELLLMLIVPAFAVTVPVEVELTPGFVVAVVLVDVAVKVIFPVVEVKEEVR